ncbi:hypothetical protein QOZ80_8AG0628070 [Eleusine coracana subsp. coracana]|nr:hypothetical protein QOZ80_8AG0628070 [Eleusine coracana subsp. coracana]
MNNDSSLLKIIRGYCLQDTNMDWSDNPKAMAYYSPLGLSFCCLFVGLYLSFRGSYGINFLQWGLISIGLFLLAIFILVHCQIPRCLTGRGLINIHLFGLLVAILALLSLMIVTFVNVDIDDVSDGPHIKDMWGRKPVREYHLSDYGGKLRRRMADQQYWATISARLRQDNACDGMSPLVRDPDTDVYFTDRASKKYPYDAGLSPVESGCCKPPLSCGFTYVNQTTWTPTLLGALAMVTTNVDCSRWSNDQQTLCFQCHSCKAGVLADIQRAWSTPVIWMTVIVVIHICMYPFKVRMLAFR